MAEKFHASFRAPTAHMTAIPKAPKFDATHIIFHPGDKVSPVAVAPHVPKEGMKMSARPGAGGRGAYSYHRPGSIYG